MKKVVLDRLRLTMGIMSCIALLLTIVLAMTATPAKADVPDGASEVEETDLLPVWIFDEDEVLQKFVIEENDLKGYTAGGELVEITFEAEDVPDGDLSLDEVVSYRLLQLVFSQLWPEDVPNAADFSVAYEHPGKDQRATLEYITQAFSRDEAELDVDAGVTEDDYDLDAYVYVFTNTDSEETFETYVLEDVFPSTFFDLRTKVQNDTATASEESVFLEKWEEARETFLTADLGELFYIEEEVASPTPYWQIIFALGLTVTMIGAVIYGRIKPKK